MSHKSILYLDDERENLDVFYYTFSDEFDIFITTSADEAFEYLKHNIVKVLLCDQRMPEIAGIDFIRQVKVAYPKVVTVLVTAFSDREIIIDAINQAGVFRFIAKPWNNKELSMILNQALEKYDLVDEHERLLKSYKAQNKQLQIEKIKAEESVKLKDAFLENISHEFRTPMNSIMGFTDLLLDENLSSEKRKMYSGIIRGSCTDLLTVLDDIIMLSQLHANTFVVSTDSLSVTKLLDIINEMLSSSSEIYSNKQNEYSIKNSVPTNLILDYGNVIQISLSKVVDNAFKFTEKGQITISIDQAEVFETPWIKLSVIDTGMGISKENHHRVFDDFFQVETSGFQLNSGNGIGLSIARATISLIGGKIEIDSELSEGTTITLWFPVEISSLASDSEEQ